MKFRIFFLICLFVLPVFAKPEAVLSSQDVKTYKAIFTALKKERIAEADTLVKKLKNKDLMGYVLYKKYMSRKYHTTQNEITSWLDKYADLPVANEIYALGKQKKASLPPKPKGLFGKDTCSYVHKVDPIDLVRHRSFPDLSSTQRVKARQQMQQVAKNLNAGRTKEARKIIDEAAVSGLFPQEELDRARVALAFSYFLDGEDDLALTYVDKALQRSKKVLPLAYWTGGLVLWRQGKTGQANTYFEKAAAHEKSFPLLKASAAFWAARTHLKMGHYKKVGTYLEEAAGYPRTFYGILALRTLGSDLEHVWDIPSKPEDEVAADFSHPALERFYALKQIGQKDWAQKELSSLYLQADKDAKGLLLMISEENGFSDDLVRLTGQLTGDDTRYPLPDWTPVGGWTLDKALVYAFVRQESCFNRYAESSVGAVGLMQIMPNTAKELAKKMNYNWNERKLREAEYNLSLGQNYIRQLLDDPEINKNLMFTAVAYNAGPGNLAKWKKRMKYQNDPLLFLESVPSKETRGFIERIMVNYWVYRSLMGQSLKSLDNVVSGRWPLYEK